KGARTERDGDRRQIRRSGAGVSQELFDGRRHHLSVVASRLPEKLAADLVPIVESHPCLPGGGIERKKHQRTPKASCLNARKSASKRSPWAHIVIPRLFWLTWRSLT